MIKIFQINGERDINRHAFRPYNFIKEFEKENIKVSVYENLIFQFTTRYGKVRFLAIILLRTSSICLI